MKRVEKDKKIVKKHIDLKTKAKHGAEVKVKIKRPKIKKVQNKPIITFGLHNLKAPVGAQKKKKLLGRGSSSGHGKTSTRGSKGQTSRAGRHFYLGFEGGQSPLIRKMPKRGFRNRFKKIFQIVNIRDLARIKEPNITLELLEQSGLIKNKAERVKVLGEGEIKSAVTIQAHAFSKKAAELIKNAGGKTEVVAY